MASEMSERVPLGGQHGMQTDKSHYERLYGKSTLGFTDAFIPSGGSQKRKRRIVRKNLGSLFDAVQGVRENETTNSVNTHRPRRRDMSQEVSEDGTVMTNSSGVSEMDAWNLSQGSGDSSYSCSPTMIDESSGRCTREEFDAVPLLDLLLETDRGKHLSLMEVKALLYSIAKDLYDIHVSGRVHTRVCFHSILLKIIEGTGRASLSAGQDTSIVHRSDLRQPRFAGETSKNDVAYIAPESFHCMKEAHSRSLTDKGNMWSFGCIVFAMLSGGNDLFGEHGVGESGMDKLLLSSVDKQQAWMSWYIENKMKDLAAKPHAQDGFARVGLDGDSVDLITRLLHVDPAQRLSAIEVLQHTWFEGVQKCIPQRSVCDSEEGFDRKSSHHSEGELLANHEFSPQHNRYIYIDPNVLSPMHPYALVGHIKKDIHFDSMGETFKGIGIFAVYDVPDHGTMMSAKPIRISPY